MRDAAETIKERQSTHGNYEEFAEIAQALKAIIRKSPNARAGMPAFMLESLEDQAMKWARILVGDATHPDHWHDIEGYARLVLQRLPT